MFTFGRDHEKACSTRYVRNKREVPRIHRVIDKVHDFLDGQACEVELRRELFEAFAEGGSGIWEQTEYWIRRLSKEHPTFATLWVELSGHPLASIRLRTACCIGGMPDDVARWVAARLGSDRSKRVREAVAARTGG